MFKPKIVFILIFLMFFLGCQKLLVSPTVNNGLQAEGRCFEVNSITWVEVKILLPANVSEWQPVFEAGTPLEFSSNSDKQFTYFRWKINRDDVKWLSKNEVNFKIRANTETHQVSVVISPVSNRVANVVVHLVL